MFCPSCKIDNNCKQKHYLFANLDLFSCNNCKHEYSDFESRYAKREYMIEKIRHAGEQHDMVGKYERKQMEIIVDGVKYVPERKQHLRLRCCSTERGPLCPDCGWHHVDAYYEDKNPTDTWSVLIFFECTKCHSKFSGKVS